MTYEHRDGSGALFPNDKGPNPSRPDWRGDLMIDGVLYEVAGWFKDGRNGEFISLQAKPKEAREEAPRPQRNTTAPGARPRPRDEAYRAQAPARRAPPPAFDDQDGPPF